MTSCSKQDTYHIRTLTSFPGKIVNLSVGELYRVGARVRCGWGGNVGSGDEDGEDGEDDEGGVEHMETMTWNAHVRVRRCEEREACVWEE